MFFETLVAYLDDLLVFSSDFSSHLKNVQLTLQRQENIVSKSKQQISVIQKAGAVFMQDCCSRWLQIRLKQYQSSKGSGKKKAKVFGRFKKTPRDDRMF